MPVHLLLDWSGTLCDDVTATLFPEAREFVRCAVERGGSARIVSSLPQRELERAVERNALADLLSGIHGGVRDKTEALPRIVAESGLSPDDCLMLGDMEHDIHAARAARVRACAILHGYSSEAVLRAEHPDEVWRDLSEARAWLERHLMLETRAWPIATVGGLVFRPEDGRAFFVRTPKWSGRWGTPGGKIDYGEGHIDAFVREIREETGLETLDPRLVLVQDAIEEPEFVRPRHFLLLNLVGTAANAPPPGLAGHRLNHESVEGGWFSLDEALELELNRPTRVLVEFLRKDRPVG